MMYVYSSKELVFFHYAFSQFDYSSLKLRNFLGIELVLGTRVKSADVRRQTLLTAAGETISYKILIVATGARVLKLIFK